MKKELPIATPPKISHQFLALPLSIIFSGNDILPLDWYFSEFTQMYTFRNDAEGIMIRTYNYDSENDYEPLESIKMLPYRLKVGKDIIELYKLMINNGYYVYVFCDDLYINKFEMKDHLFHDILIHGYDDEKQSFCVYGYNGPKLAKYHVLYNDFIKAYESEVFQDVQQLTIFYRKKEQAFGLNIEKIKWHLLDYYEGVDTMKRERTHLPRVYKPKWGLDIYEEIINMYERHVRDKSEIGHSETYCLYEHKRDMTKRVQYLNEKTNIHCTDDMIELFSKVEKEAKELVNLVMKINIRKYKANDFDRLKEHVENIYSYEKEALDKYIDYNQKEFIKI